MKKQIPESVVEVSAPKKSLLASQEAFQAFVDNPTVPKGDVEHPELQARHGERDTSVDLASLTSKHVEVKFIDVPQASIHVETK